MIARKRFSIIYAPLVRQHIKTIEIKYYSLLREALQEQLQFHPDIETRNRKPLKRPVVFGTKWEIRFGLDNRFRAFYRVDYDHDQVIVLAIGEKIGNRLFFGGEEVEI